MDPAQCLGYVCELTIAQSKNHQCFTCTNIINELCDYGIIQQLAAMSSLCKEETKSVPLQFCKSMKILSVRLTIYFYRGVSASYLLQICCRFQLVPVAM